MASTVHQVRRGRVTRTLRCVATMNRLWGRVPTRNRRTTGDARSPRPQAARLRERNGGFGETGSNGQPLAVPALTDSGGLRRCQ